APAETSAASTEAKVDPVPTPLPEPEQERVVSRVAPQTLQNSAQMVHPAVEPAKPNEQKLESPEETQAVDRTIAETVEQKMNGPDAPKIQPVDPIIQAQPNVEPSAREALQQTQPEPLIHNEPLVARSQPTPSSKVLAHEDSHQPATQMNDATPAQSQP